MNTVIFKNVKHRFNHIVFSNKFYNTILKPFDKTLFEIVWARKLTEERKKSLPINKICQVADIYHPAWIKTSNELKWDIDENNFHRKIWEYTQILFSLKQLEFLNPESLCLAVGAGREHLLYYLTYKIKKVFGIDLYEGKYYGGEDEKDIPISTERYAPFPYFKEKLSLFRMNALKLEFPDNYFDFIFSASSIEHFGTKKDILKSIKEMYRVLKPGGVTAITTELKLNSLGTTLPNVKPFFFKELMDLIHKAGFNTSKEFDSRIEKEYFDNWVKLPEEINKRPHVILRFFNTIFTSIHLVLQKEGNKAFRGEEVYPSIPRFVYQGDIKINSKKNIFKRKEGMSLEIILKNKSNFKWINTGHSHRIALGVKLYNLQNKLIDRDFGTIVFPREVYPGETLHFTSTITPPQEKGDWILRFDLKKELVFWFSEKGNPATDLTIKVI